MNTLYFRKHQCKKNIPHVNQMVIKSQYPTTTFWIKFLIAICKKGAYRNIKQICIYQREKKNNKEK